MGKNDSGNQDNQKDSSQIFSESRIKALELINGVSSAKIEPSTKVENLTSVDVEELVIKKTALASTLGVRYAIRPIRLIEPDPQFWFVREQLYRKVALQADPALSRKREELWDVWTAPNSDVLGRLGYLNITTVKSTDGDDSPTARAARLMALVEAKYWSLSQDLFHALAFLRQMQCMPGTGWGKLFISKLTTAKLNTMIADLQGLPINKDLMEAVLEKTRPSIRTAVNTQPSQNYIVYRIPAVIYGVMHDKGIKGWAAPTLSNKGVYDPKYRKDYFIQDDESWGGAALDFFPAHPNSNAASYYGWNFTHFNAAANHLCNYAGIGDTDYLSDAFLYDPRLYSGSTANSSAYKIVESVLMHIHNIANRMNAIIGSTEGMRGFRANSWIGNKLFKPTNSVPICETLFTSDTSLFKDKFNPYQFLRDVSDNMANPSDDVEVVRNKMTLLRKGASPIRSFRYITRGNSVTTGTIGGSFTRDIRASETIVESDMEKSKSVRQTLIINSLSTRVLMFYKSLAFEVTNFIDKYQNYWTQYQGVTDDQQQEWLPNPNTIQFRPDITIGVNSTACSGYGVTANPTQLWNSNCNQLGCYQALPYSARVDNNNSSIITFPFASYMDEVVTTTEDDAVSISINSTHKLMDAFMLNTPTVNFDDSLSEFFGKKQSFSELLGHFEYSPSNTWNRVNDSYASRSLIATAYEWVKMLSGLDSCKIYTSYDEAADFMTFNKTKTFIDMNLAMHDQTFDFVAKFSTTGTAYDSIAFKTFDGEDIGTDTTVIKPWTPRQHWNYGDETDTDEWYCVDYELLSGVAGSTNVVVRDSEPAVLPLWMLKVTSFDTPFLDILNAHTDSHLNPYSFFGGGALSDNNSKFTKLHVMAAMWRSGVLIRNTRYISDLYTNVDADNAKLNQVFITADDLGNSISDNEYDRIIAIRPYANWNDEDVFGDVFGNAYTPLFTNVLWDINSAQARFLNMFNVISKRHIFGIFHPRRASMYGIQKVNSAAAAFYNSGDIYDSFQTDEMKVAKIPDPGLVNLDKVGLFNYIQSPFAYDVRAVKLKSKDKEISDGETQKNKSKSKQKPSNKPSNGKPNRNHKADSRKSSNNGDIEQLTSKSELPNKKNGGRKPPQEEPNKLDVSKTKPADTDFGGE